MKEKERTASWPYMSDKAVVFCVALLPVGIVLGNVAYEAVTVLGCLFWVLGLVITRRNPFGKTSHHKILVTWFFWFCAIMISLFVNGAGSKGWGHDIALFRYVLLGLAIFDVSKRVPVGKYFIWGLLAAILIAGINISSALIFGHDLISRPMTRYMGKHKESQRIAGMAAFALPAIISWLFQKKKIYGHNRFFLLIMSILLLFELLFTRARTAIIAGFAGTSTFIFLNKGKGLFSKSSMATLLLILTILAALVHGTSRWTNFYNVGASIYGRLYIYKVSWKIFEDHPLVGVGISSFKDIFIEKAKTIPGLRAPDGKTYRHEEATHAHNAFMMILASTGLLGLFAFTCFFVSVVNTLLKLPPDIRIGLAPWPVVYLLIGLAGFNVYHSWYQAVMCFWISWIIAESNSTKDLG